MEETSLSFRWDNNVFFKVENEIFSVPRSGFFQLSEVFSGMFLLPSGSPGPEGLHREHPIVLEGYKKEEFACLLSVMYPTADTIISGDELAFDLKMEEWLSVLKLSEIWNMEKIKSYAVRRLSTDFSLSPIKKILLSREYKVSEWLHEGIASVVNGDTLPFEEISSLGLDTATRILWIRDKLRSQLIPKILYFNKGSIKCSSGHCSSNSILIDLSSCETCGKDLPDDAELCFLSTGSEDASDLGDTHIISLNGIRSTECGGSPFEGLAVECRSCYFDNFNVSISNFKIQPHINVPEEMIKEMFD